MEKFDYFNPKTIDEALSLFNQYGKKAMYIAGGTDVIVMTKWRIIR
jgi:CO/xanthine dehydrogenase FAD-binding subunit